MRCKTGDMAIVISGDRNNVGRAVTCLRVFAEHPSSKSLGPIWQIDRELSWFIGCEEYLAPFAPDNCLLPIRPERDEDDLPAERGKSGRITGTIRVTAISPETLLQILFGDSGEVDP